MTAPAAARRLGARRLVLRARAKVNLGLEILGRRPDGYHEIRTVLLPVDLADRLTVETTPGEIGVTCDAPGVPPGPANLAWRAADLLRRAAGIQAGARIHIEKRIPPGGGLGGGSADAAAVLVGLGRLWRARLGPDSLRALAVQLGMDVPFFLGGGPALGVARGEILEPLRGVRPLWLVLVNPGFPLSTPAVYGQVHSSDWSAGARVRLLAGALREGPAAVARCVYNGLEAAATRLWPGLHEVRAALVAAGAAAAVMSGSGPTVAGVATSRTSARAVARALADRPWRCWVARSVAGPPVSILRPLRGRRAAAPRFGRR